MTQECYIAFDIDPELNLGGMESIPLEWGLLALTLSVGNCLTEQFVFQFLAEQGKPESGELTPSEHKLESGVFNPVSLFHS